MPNRKISELADGAPAVATDQIPVARAGETLRLTLANLQALASVTSNEVSAVSATAAAAKDVVSNAVSVVSQALSVETAARVLKDDAISNAVSVVSQALSVETAARVIAVDAVSNAVSVVSQALSVHEAALSARINTVSNAASNALSIANTVSNALSNEISNRVSADGVLAAAINVVSNGLSDLVSAHNVLSNRVSANSATGGGGSVTSAEVDAVSAQAASAINVVSAAVAVLAPNVKILQGDFTVSTSGLTDISGMIVTAAAVSGLYEMNATLFVRYTSTAAATVGFGLTFPGMKAAGGELVALMSVTSAGIYVTSGTVGRAFFMEDASGSILLSLTPAATMSATRPQPVFYRGTFLVSTAGNIALQARSSSALTTSAPVIAAGSHVRLIKLN